MSAKTKYYKKCSNPLIQLIVGEKRCVTTPITAAKETKIQFNVTYDFLFPLNYVGGL